MHHAQARDVAAGPRQAGGEAIPYRICDEGEDNRNRLGCLSGSSSCWRRRCDNNVDVESDQLCRERRETIGFSLRPALMEGDVPPLHVAQIRQALPKCLTETGDIGRRIAPQNADAGNLTGLLSIGDEREEQQKHKNGAGGGA